MSRQSSSGSRALPGASKVFQALARLIGGFFSSPRRVPRKRLKAHNLPPELMRDIGLTEDAPHGLSLEEKWRLEMELQSK